MSNYKQINAFEDHPIFISNQVMSYLTLFLIRLYFFINCYINYNLMKVGVKSVLKTSDLEFQCFEEYQIMFRSGNMLCVKEIEKGQSLFIPLKKHIDRLYAFKVSTNRKGVITAQRHGQQLELAYYSLSGDRKSISLSNQSLFFSQIEELSLLVDEYENNLIYGFARNRESSCVFLCDFNKGRIIATGFLQSFSCMKADQRENMSVIISGYSNSHNYLKQLRYGMNQWQITQQIYRKIQEPVIHHELLTGNRVLLITKTQAYVYEQSQYIQTLQLSNGSSPVLELVKVQKAFIIRYQNNCLRLMFEQSDQRTFTLGQQMTLELLTNQSIFKIATSPNLQEVVIRTTEYNIYVWRCEHLSISTDKSQLIFNRVFNGCHYSKEGSISISTGKKYSLLVSENNVTIWSIQRNQLVLSTDFSIPSDPNRKVLFSGAINPDGNSILLGFQDKVKLYKVLLTKLKIAYQFNIKRCQNIVFSHGGQLAACRFGKNMNTCITIINLVRLVQLYTWKIQAQPKQYVWNQLDDQLIISTEAQAIQIYGLSENSKLHHVKIGEEITQVRLDYKTKQLIVSTEKHVMFIENGKIIQTIQHPISNFHYLFPLYGVYFATTKTGQLIWSYSIKFQTQHEIPLFSNRTYNLVCRNSYLVAYASFEDITVLYCERPNYVPKTNTGQDIVMIERDEVTSFFDKVKYIDSNYEALVNGTQVKLEDERNRYEKAVLQHKLMYEKQLAFLHSKLNELSSEKAKQERENEKIFEKLENGQIKSVNELQRMFDRKLSIQKERCLNLQQAILQQKLKYEKVIADIQFNYHKDTSAIRQEYSQRMKQQCSRMQDVKSKTLGDKMQMEVKLFDLEDENQNLVSVMQSNSQNIILQMKIKYQRLQQQYQDLQASFHNQKKDIEKRQMVSKEKKKESQAMKAKLGEFQSRINLLQKEIVNKNIMIQERNRLIEEQTHQIIGLEKAKYVLSFRTTQIRKQLEPKQQQLDKLKCQMFKLEQQFKEERKKNYSLQGKVQKLQRINDIYKRDVSDLKINLKYKQRLHQQLCSEIFTVVNNIDPKQWNSSFIKIYQTYIQETKYEKRENKKKDDTVEELNRHLIHVEESLIQVTSGTEKVLRGKQKQVMRKMKENSELVYELNVMRKKQTQYHKERKDLHSQNARLKREINESMKSTLRTPTNYTAITRRIVSQDGGQRDKSLNLEIREPERDKSRNNLKSSRIQRSKLASARRTLHVQIEKKQNQNRIFDVARELQSARGTIKRQDRLIQQLNQRLLGTITDQE